MIYRDARLDGVHPSNPDNTVALQKAIDDVGSFGGYAGVSVPGQIQLLNPITARNKVDIVGNGINDTQTVNVRTRLQWPDTGSPQPHCLIVPDKSVQDFKVRNLELQCGSGWQNILTLKEVHWPVLEDVYFIGKPENAAVELGATLYTKMVRPRFSLSNGVCIDAERANHPITYYGAGQLMIEDGTFFSRKGAFRGEGTVTFRGGSIETSFNECPAQIHITGVTPGHTFVYILQTYFELGNAAEAAEPLRCFKTDMSTHGVISPGAINGRASPTNGESIAFDFNGQEFNGQLGPGFIVGFDWMYSAPAATSQYHLMPTKVYDGGGIMQGGVPAGSSSLKTVQLSVPDAQIV